jgi:O-antigen/teichoic acid export membrane protein
MALVGGTLGAICLAFASSWLATHTLAAPHLSKALRSSSALVLFSTVQSACTGALAGFEAFRRSAWVNLFGGVLGTPFIVLGAWCWAVTGAVWGMNCQAVLTCIVACFALVQEMKKDNIPVPFGRIFRPSGVLLAEFNVLWAFSLPAFLSSALVGPVNWACSTILVNQPKGYAQAALLSAANQWKNFVDFLPLMLSSVVVPVLVKLHTSGQHADFMRLLKRQVAIHIAVCGALVAPLMVLCGPIMRSYGPGFGDGTSVLVLTLVNTVLIAVSNPLSKSMQSAGKAWWDLGFSALWASVLLGGSVVLIPRHLALGGAISQLLAATAITVSQWYFLHRVLSPKKEPIPVEALSRENAY